MIRQTADRGPPRIRRRNVTPGCALDRLKTSRAMRISLDQLRSATVALDWHEAVAVDRGAGWSCDRSGATAARTRHVPLTPSGEFCASGSGRRSRVGAARGLADRARASFSGATVSGGAATSGRSAVRGSRFHRGARRLPWPASSPNWCSSSARAVRAVLAALASRAEAALQRARDACRVRRFHRARLGRRDDAGSGVGAISAGSTGTQSERSRDGYRAECVAGDVRDERASATEAALVPAIVATTVFLRTAYAVASWFAPAPSPASVTAEGSADEEPGAGID